MDPAVAELPAIRCSRWRTRPAQTFGRAGAPSATSTAAVPAASAATSPAPTTSPERGRRGLLAAAGWDQSQQADRHESEPRRERERAQHPAGRDQAGRTGQQKRGGAHVPGHGQRSRGPPRAAGGSPGVEQPRRERGDQQPAGHHHQGRGAKVAEQRPPHRRDCGALSARIDRGGGRHLVLEERAAHRHRAGHRAPAAAAAAPRYASARRATGEQHRDPHAHRACGEREPSPAGEVEQPPPGGELAVVAVDIRHQRPRRGRDPRRDGRRHAPQSVEHHVRAAAKLEQHAAVTQQQAVRLGRRQRGGRAERRRSHQRLHGGRHERPDGEHVAGARGHQPSTTRSVTTARTDGSSSEETSRPLKLRLSTTSAWR